MRFGSVSCGLFAVALTLAAPSVALADPSPQDISQARDLGQQAQAALDAGNFAESERLWKAAAELYPAAPTLTLGLARSQAKQGKYVLAKESYNKSIREQSNNPNASQAFKDALAAAQTEIDQVSAKIAHVTITVSSDGGAPPSTVVTIDSENVPAAGLGVPRNVDPGQHTVKASADGYSPAETTFTVGDAGNAEAKLSLTKLASVAPPPTNQGSTELAGHPAPKTDHTYAAIAFGVGGAGLVLGLITGGIALGKHGDLSDACTNGKCPNDKKDDVSSYHTVATLSTVGFIVAGVGAAAGAVLWFAGPKKEVSTGLTWHPYVGAGNGGVTGTF